MRIRHLPVANHLGIDARAVSANTKVVGRKRVQLVSMRLGLAVQLSTPVDSRAVVHTGENEFGEGSTTVIRTVFCTDKLCASRGFIFLFPPEARLNNRSWERRK